MMSRLSNHPALPPLQADRFVGALLGRDAAGSKTVVEAGDILVVKGGRGHDDIGSVLDSVSIPYTVVNPLKQWSPSLWSAAKLAFVECNDYFLDLTDHIAGWVFSGGVLVTTDHAVSLLESGFQNGDGQPLYVGRLPDRYVQESEAATIEVSVSDWNDPISALFFEQGRRPQWRIKHGNWPIKIFEPGAITTVAGSPLLGCLFDGADALIVKGTHGEGRFWNLFGHIKDQLLGIDPSERPPDYPPSRIRRKGE